MSTSTLLLLALALLVALASAVPHCFVDPAEPTREVHWWYTESSAHVNMVFLNATVTDVASSTQIAAGVGYKHMRRRYHTLSLDFSTSPSTARTTKYSFWHDDDDDTYEQAFRMSGATDVLRCAGPRALPAAECRQQHVVAAALGNAGLRPAFFEPVACAQTVVV